jgi:hypothetical protein
MAIKVLIFCSANCWELVRHFKVAMIRQSFKDMPTGRMKVILEYLGSLTLLSVAKKVERQSADL